jgi:hypothetical protein
LRRTRRRFDDDCEFVFVAVLGDGICAESGDGVVDLSSGAFRFLLLVEGAVLVFVGRVVDVGVFGWVREEDLRDRKDLVLPGTAEFGAVADFGEVLSEVMTSVE